jgi:DNA-binding response OmpR family regulator
MKVLVVDDDQDLAGAIKTILQDEGMDVMSASDGRGGILRISSLNGSCHY